jgi:hypothetical protein
LLSVLLVGCASSSGLASNTSTTTTSLPKEADTTVAGQRVAVAALPAIPGYSYAATSVNRVMSEATVAAGVATTGFLVCSLLHGGIVIGQVNVVVLATVPNLAIQGQLAGVFGYDTKARRGSATIGTTAFDTYVPTAAGVTAEAAIWTRPHNVVYLVSVKDARALTPFLSALIAAAE